MNSAPLSPGGQVRYREYKKLFEAKAAASGLPVEEHCLTQVGSGVLEYYADIIAASEVALMRLRSTTLSVGVTVLDPSYTCFIFPIRWGGEYRINGELVNSSAFFLPSSLNAFDQRSDGRDMLAIILNRGQFVETVAALRGIGPEDVTVREGAQTMAAESLAKVRRRLNAVLENYRREDSRRTCAVSAEELGKQVIEMATDAYLFSASESEAKNHGFLQSQRIVRKAEERFEAAEDGRISLADLCAAAGVSKSSLYKAFDSVCGEPPISYFYKRRMMKSRLILIESPYERGTIKRAALGAGFTELGRFSVEYRRMFGESPSVTLTKSSL
ncbi:helix-turn-helix domain-containing protein [Candidatus Micrarchaeota archaeon]|nr:helix-turn-helix domain-containing protein [Candidatus Micrarchaeota archaeon]